MTLSHTLMAEVDEKSNEATENICSNSCIEKHARMNTSIDDLVLQSDHAFEFPNEPVSLTVDPMFVSNDSEVNRAHSTITKEAGSKLNPYFEPYVPTGSLEKASTSTSPGQGDCDVKPFDPKDFHDKKVTPNAKPTNRSVRTDQSSKPRVKPQKVT
ncbi:hypothetical protein R6Q57_021387 [Mikania cordata]